MEPAAGSFVLCRSQPRIGQQQPAVVLHCSACDALRTPGAVCGVVLLAPPYDSAKKHLAEANSGRRRGQRLTLQPAGSELSSSSALLVPCSLCGSSAAHAASTVLTDCAAAGRGSTCSDLLPIGFKRRALLRVR